MLPTSTGKTYDYDVVVVGGGPAGATVATLLSRAGLAVAVFERERFPRFHVGESLLPANLPIFDHLGCHDAMRQMGFLVKPGASFYDEYEGRGSSTFSFQQTPFQPAFAYNVVRATFDDLLLRHAESVGAHVYRQHTVKQPRLETHQVTVQVQAPDATSCEVRARFLVDASGRTALLGSGQGKREPIPDLGKVALFAHFRGAHRDPAIPAGNIRIHLVRDGWIWWIPFADGTDSIGCVLHAQVVKERGTSIERLFEAVLASSPRLTHGLAEAQRITTVHSAANFSYRINPVVGQRYVAVGDAAGFVDPIFSSGVFLAMRSAELAATYILKAFRQHDFSARALAPYATRLRRGVRSFLAFIQRFYEPAFLDLFFSENPPVSLYKAIIWVLSGAAFDHRSLWWRGNLAFFFTVVHVRKAIRRVTGLPTESRWRW